MVKRACAAVTANRALRSENGRAGPRNCKFLAISHALSGTVSRHNASNDGHSPPRCPRGGPTHALYDEIPWLGGSGPAVSVRCASGSRSVRTGPRSGESQRGPRRHRHAARGLRRLDRRDGEHAGGRGGRDTVHGELESRGPNGPWQLRTHRRGFRSPAPGAGLQTIPGPGRPWRGAVQRAGTQRGRCGHRDSAGRGPPHGGGALQGHRLPD